GWIGNDEVGPECRGAGPLWIRFRAGTPRRLQDLGNHRAFLRHILDDLVKVGRDNAATGLDDVLHQRMRISTKGIEFESGVLDHGPKLAMGRDAHPVPLRKPADDRDEWLHDAPRDPTQGDY